MISENYQETMAEYPCQEVSIDISSLKNYTVKLLASLQGLFWIKRWKRTRQ